MALISKEKIASEANIILGGEPIADLDTDSREAEVMSNLIDLTFESLISEETWNFAIKDAVLSILNSTPNDPRYEYEGRLPINFIKLINVYDTSGSEIEEYDVVEGKILLNVKDVRIKYTYLPSNYDFPDYFRKLLVYTLASDACEAITGSTSLQNTLIQKAERQFKKARIADGSANDRKNHFNSGRITRGRY